MPSQLTVVLWPGSGQIFEKDLLGRPLWQRTLEAAQPLRPKRALLLLNKSGRRFNLNGLHGVEPVSKRRFPDALAGLRGRLLLLPAEMPCVSSRSLRRLVAASRSGPSRLLATGKSTPILCCTAGRLRTAAGAPRSSLDSIADDLQASAIRPAPAEELLEVRTNADWAEAIRVLRRRTVERLLAAGVLIDDPTTVHIDPDVKVGRRTRIRGWVVIEGASRIGTGCDVGSFTHIVDSVVGSRTVLLDHCLIRSSRIGRGAQVGPFAHLRPESTLGNKTKVGNFVEMKKSTLGAGSKAPHLTYLGDAEVGRRVNVGAGTITCNYDGSAKHQTVIEDGAFIGSDVQLVAPVRIGRGAYVAAGSTIVEDVPAGSLAVARGRQVVKAGYARRARGKKRKS
jgi:acyl-[acyl carrier protein]--UDP-N-acetylglucosamine O-acyltransferase/molybdopterin-guanine dinucleotide biosynthesis protein A